MQTGQRRRSTRLSVIVPATNDPPTLKRALPAIQAGLYPGEQLIVVTEPPNAGPAQARNAGAATVDGDVLVFVDADVVLHADVLARLRTAFDADPRLAAVFGSYDDGPTSPAVISQFRNLLHHHVHQSCPGPAKTFWAGLGAVRREAFSRVGGFDAERYAVPSIEDIELGARLTAAGAQIELHPRVKGTHLKHWTMGNMVRTDFLQRGIPWVELMLASRSAPTTLNLSWRERASTVLTVLALPTIALRRRRPVSVLLAAIAVINAPFYWMLMRRMGLIRAMVGIGLHGLHRLIAVVSVPAGILVHLRRVVGMRRAP
jgi:cellulose synthase/poly-beta-1,6-N-acetylglucosamine synthase-like glycosyltransferase